MKDRVLSPEGSEEVIELLDIVDPASSEDQNGEHAEQILTEVPLDEAEPEAVIELGAEDLALADDALELTDVVAQEEGDVLELTDLAESPAETSVGELEGAEAGAEAHPVPECEASEAEEQGGEAATAMDVSSDEVPAGEVAEKDTGAASSDVEAVLSLVAELDERMNRQEAARDAAFRAMEERLASLELRCAELDAKVEGLQQQLSECSSMFLGDAGVRLALEEMVSRMIEARMPAIPEYAEECEVQADAEYSVPAEIVSSEIATDRTGPEESLTDAEPVEQPEENAPEGDVPAEEPEEEGFSPQAVLDTIDELVLHLGELEERVSGWEVRCEQEAALAAARVIREEIAALRAGAARTGR